MRLKLYIIIIFKRFHLVKKNVRDFRSHDAQMMFVRPISLLWFYLSLKTLWTLHVGRALRSNIIPDEIGIPQSSNHSLATMLSENTCAELGNGARTLSNCNRREPTPMQTPLQFMMQRNLSHHRASQPRYVSQIATMLPQSAERCCVMTLRGPLTPVLMVAYARISTLHTSHRME